MLNEPFSLIVLGTQETPTQRLAENSLKNVIFSFLYFENSQEHHNFFISNIIGIHLNSL